MRISDWSSDVCSSDLHPFHLLAENARPFADEGQHADRFGIGLAGWQALAYGDQPVALAVDLHVVAVIVGLHADRDIDRAARPGARKSTRLNSSHYSAHRMPSSA